MGWNTYYQVGGSFNESTIKSVANSLSSTGLRAAGYKIVWLDFGWATGQRDSQGNLIVSSTQWPNGMKGLTDWLHRHGFQAGIYTDAGMSGCSNSGVGSYGHYAAGSTNPYSQDVNQFAAWGFDAVKVDFCGAGEEWADTTNTTTGYQTGKDPQTLYGLFSQAVANAPRSMIFNVCNFWLPGGIPGTNGTLPLVTESSWDNYQWAPPIAQSWRTDTDIGYGGGGGIPWWAVLRNLDQNSTPQPDIQNAAGPPGASPISWGHWNDPDYLGPGIQGTKTTSINDTQAQSQFSMWAMVAAPLILGSDPRSLSSTNINMLKNSNVIALDQDSSGAQGYPLSQPTSIGQQSGQQVWVKPLAGGARAVALFNRGSSAAQITTSASAVGMPSASQYTLLDVWTRQTSTTTDTITATVPANAVVLYRVTAG